MMTRPREILTAIRQTAILLTGAVLLPGLATAAVVNPFNINVVFDNPDTAGVSGDHNFSPAQQAVFTSAEAFWEQRLLGNRYDLAIPALTIFAFAESIDGVSGTLASAGPTGAGGIAGDGTGGIPDYFYALEGKMRFDTADIGTLSSAGTFLDAIVHEMAHVIGFGTLWNTAQFGGSFVDTQSVYTDGTGQFTGAYALDTYNAEFGLTSVFVPVELDGGSGTANGHWDEQTFAGGRLDALNSSDLMTGFLGPLAPFPDAPLIGTTISDTTIASFADIGYLTSVTDPLAAVPLPPTVALSLVGLLCLGLRRRARRAA